MADRGRRDRADLPAGGRQRRGRCRRGGRICRGGCGRRRRSGCGRRRRGGGCCRERAGGVRGGVRGGAQPPVKTEVGDVRAAGVGDRARRRSSRRRCGRRCRPSASVQVTLRLARLLARLVEASAMSEPGEDHRGASAPARGRVCAPVDARAGGAQHRVGGAPVRAARARGRAGLAGRRRSRSSTRTPAARARRRDGRLGFKELVAEVGLGQVGLVLALEVSRFARSSADWHQLLDLCALTGTLIADADGVYSPADFNDRLLLGLKGTMSRGRAASDPRAAGRRAAQQGRARRAAAGAAGRARPRRGRPDRAVPGRAGPPRDRARVRAVAAARAPPGRSSAELIAEGQQLPRRTVGAAARALGARELWRRARLPDQPGVCRRVRVRPHPPGEAPRRARARPGPDGRAADRGVVCLPARAPSRLCLLARVPRRRASGCERT